MLAQHRADLPAHRHECQHGCQEHSAAGREATDRHGTHEGKNKGRFGAQRQSALYDPSYPRGGELQAGARFGSLAGAETHQGKTVNPNSAPCGPVCGFGSRVGTGHQRSPKQALLSQRGAAVNEHGRPDEPKKDEMQPPYGGGVKEADRARQRRKELAHKLTKISPPDHNISPQNQAVEKGVKKEQEKE